MKTKILLVLLIVCFSHVQAQQQELVVLCYHDVKDVVLADFDDDQYAVSTDNLVAHFNWLKTHGYTVVSMQDILSANKAGITLPEKSVLLTFDDGYKSFYTIIYPLLKLYDYPAVFALVGKWIEDNDKGVVAYGDTLLTKEDFLTWEQIQEMHNSGLIEFASHSYNLHKGIIANPQANLIPAAIAHTYDQQTNLYETEAEQLERVHNDLKINSELIESKIGFKPRVMVWPYGAYNSKTMAVAEQLGMPYNLTLGNKKPNISNLDNIGRILISSNPEIDNFKQQVSNANPKQRQRIVHVDLDYVFDENKSQQKKNLDILIERIQTMQVTTVYLQAFADPDADGVADELYFPNKYLPVREDLFSRVSWQLKTRANVDVYAWMPLLAFNLSDTKKREALQVKTNGKINRSPGVYTRLSPFNLEARSIIKEIYRDLAKHTVVDGLLFHDDAVLTDFEDTSASAIEVYTKQWNLPANPLAYKDNPEHFQKWSKLKTKWMIDFSKELANIVAEYQKDLKTARNIYAEVVLNPESEAWYAQNFKDFVKAYDFTAIMAMPYLENSTDPESWLSGLLDKVNELPEAIKKTVFELQTVDWRSQDKIPTNKILEHIKLLSDGNVHHIGYYPDDFIQDHPSLDDIISGISINDYPYDFPK